MAPKLHFQNNLQNICQILTLMLAKGFQSNINMINNNDIRKKSEEKINAHVNNIIERIETLADIIFEEGIAKHILNNHALLFGHL